MVKSSDLTSGTEDRIPSSSRNRKPPSRRVPSDAEIRTTSIFGHEYGEALADSPGDLPRKVPGRRTTASARAPGRVGE